VARLVAEVDPEVARSAGGHLWRDSIAPFMPDSPTGKSRLALEANRKPSSFVLEAAFGADGDFGVSVVLGLLQGGQGRSSRRRQLSGGCFTDPRAIIAELFDQLSDVAALGIAHDLFFEELQQPGFVRADASVFERLDVGSQFLRLVRPYTRAKTQAGQS
jgi:hypothetical protein